MLTYSFSNIGSDSLYKHLYKAIKNDIINGTLPVDTKLPSKRTFAKNLGISTITVENAYAQLIAEGYIYSVPKKGYFIAEIKNNYVENKVVSKTNTLTLPSNQSPFLEEPNHFFANFTNNETNIENFPFSIWAKIIREILNEKQQELVTKSPCGGIFALRKAIAEHLKAFRNMTVEPEQIIIGAGTEYLYGLLIQLLGFDKNYGVEDPGYDKISLIYKKHNVSCDFIQMDKSGVKIEALEEKNIDVIHISPSHHFPTGLIMPISRRYEILGWASKSDSRYIIEDDYDSEFRFVGQPIPSMQNIDVLEKVIYMNTFTKTLASTVRISYMILPKHLLYKFYNELSFYSCTVSNFEQYTLARFIECGYFEKHINRMRNYYHTKRDLLLNIIKSSPLSSYATITEKDSGLHFLMQLDTPLSDQDFCIQAKNQGIKIAPLSGFYTNPPENVEHIFLINYSSLPNHIMEEAIERLIAIFD